MNRYGNHVFLIAILLAGFVQAQTFSERSRAAYEAATPSQRQNIRDAIRSGSQIKLTPHSMTTTSGTASGLVFLKGLYCKEWSANDVAVRKSWLAQYLDATSSREQNPRGEYRNIDLETVNQYCQDKPSESVEMGFAYAYRKAEAERIRGNSEAYAKLEESRQRREAAAEAIRSEKINPNNNPLLQNKAESYACGEWDKVDINIKTSWLKQYFKSKDADISPSSEVQSFRLQRMCAQYPKLPAFKVINHIYDLDRNSTKTQLTATSTTANAGMSNVSWKNEYQVQGLMLTIMSINDNPPPKDAELTKLAPGFYEVRYSCGSYRLRVGNAGVTDLYIEPNTEYFLSAITHEPNSSYTAPPLVPGVNYTITPETRGSICGVMARQCEGQIYIDVKYSTIMCEAKSREGLMDFFSSSHWVMD
ncbi:MAG: hypothetical protein KBE07_08890 [Rhodoferax sp.]|nr:hypothetical protein [Rhodoferax sp.]